MHYLAGGFWLHVETQCPGSRRSRMSEWARSLTALRSTRRIQRLYPFKGPLATDVRPQGWRPTPMALTPFQPGSPSGAQKWGHFPVSTKLTADFGNMTISGCVGCDGDILLSGAAQDGVTGRTVGFYSVPSDFEVRLGAAPISNDGSFTQNNVTATSQATPVRNSSGSWGGRFSSIQDAEGDPRLVAGTFGGEFSTHGGSDAVFLGAFGAGKQ